MAQFIPEIYNKIIIKIVEYFWGVTGYGYTVIQVVCWVEIPEQMRLCPIFVKIWIPIMGHNSVVSGYPKSTGTPRLTGCQRNPGVLGCHKLNYDINEKELLAIIKGINKFEVFLLPKPFIIETDNTQVAGFIKNNTGK